MAIGVQIGNQYWEIGTAGFLHAFFSTVSYRLEPDGWGTRFPMLMNQLYQGTLGPEQAGTALTELAGVKRELAAFPPSALVWDIENLDAQPPWGDKISPAISSLANYFVTSDGRDLIEVLEESLSVASRSRTGMSIR